jgi:regulator of sirC expression with transglutaminase-like and TPR domain
VEVTERFCDLMARPEALVPLDEACLLIASHGDPSLDITRELDRLDELASGCPAPTLDALVRHLFVDLGFRGNHRSYYDPRNSYLHHVVASRRGIPISLSVVMICVGRRIGVPLAGVGMPGHFLVRDKVDPSVYVDPFAGGRLLDRRGCEQAFHRVQGPEACFDERFLEPVGTFAILARMLANLRAIFAATGDHRSLVWVLRLRTAVPGVPVEERSELAAALAATGDLRGAALELEAVAAVLGGTVGDEYARRAQRLRARLN